MAKRNLDPCTRSAFGELGNALRHDLGAPVRHVSSFAGLLARSLGDNLSADQEKCASLLNGAVGRLDLMVAAMGKYCELLSAEPDLEPLDLGQVLEEAQERWRFRTERGSGHMRWEENFPRVLASGSQMQLLLAALLDNSSTYIDSDRDSIVRVESKVGGGRCEIVVSDNGVGLAPKYRDRATKLFWKLSSDSPGVGAGLSIARCVAEAHGGQLEIGDRADGEDGISIRFSLLMDPTQ